MNRLCVQFYEVCQLVGQQLGAGHSEVVYQKACGQFLQAMGVSHHMEHHVPVVVQIPDALLTQHIQSPLSTTFHVGDERIDILMYDNACEVHIVELKAVCTKVSPAKPSPHSVLSASHVQLLKYIRLLRKDSIYASRIHTGYLVNFRQHVVHGAPHTMTVEFDIYDAKKDEWIFGYTPDEISFNTSNISNASSTTIKPPSVISLQ
jgi:hypothetical protein